MLNAADYSDALNGALRNPRIIERRRGAHLRIIDGQA